MTERNTWKEDKARSHMDTSIEANGAQPIERSGSVEFISCRMAIEDSTDPTIVDSVDNNFVSSIKTVNRKEGFRSKKVLPAKVNCSDFLQ